MRRLLPAVTIFVALTAAMCTSLLATAAQADGGRVVREATPQDRLYTIFFEGDRGIALGSAGQAQVTADGGKTWNPEPVPTELAIFAITGNGSRSIAVGQLGLVLIRDGDGPWRQVDSGSEMRLLGVGINADGLAFATGAFGTLLRSTDGGESWSSAAPNWADLYDSGEGDTALLRDEPTNYLVEVLDDGRVLLGGEYGQLMQSVDEGASWSVLYRHQTANDTIAPTIFDIKLNPEGVGYAVGQAGLVLRTDDGGRSWTSKPTGVRNSLFAVDVLPDGQVVAIGQRVALHSDTEGARWQLIDEPEVTLNWYSGLGHGSSTSDGEVFAVGHSGQIFSLVVTP